MKETSIGNFFGNFFLTKIYLTVGLVNVECERSLSALKRVKTYARTTMCQSRLSSLAILHFNNDCIDIINYE